MAPAPSGWWMRRLAVLPRWAAGMAPSLLMLGMVPPAAAHAQQPPPGTVAEPLQRPVDPVLVLKKDARVVTLDVIVTDRKGTTVRNLQPSEFTLLEDGVPVQVTGFEEHRRTDRAQGRTDAKLPPNTFTDRLPPVTESGAVVMVLDTLDSPVVTDQMYLRNQLLSYMKTVAPGTRIAIVQLDMQLHLVQDFSSDPVELLAALEGKRDMPKVSASPLSSCNAGVPLPGEVSTPFQGANTAGIFATVPGDISGLEADTALGRSTPLGDVATCFGGLQQAEFRRLYTQLSSEQRRDILGQSMPGLMNFMAGIPGRKSVVWFYSQAEPEAAYDITMNALFTLDHNSLLDDLGAATSMLTVNQVTLFMVNTAAASWNVALENAAMNQFAHERGGAAFYNTNGLKEVMQHVEDSAWNFYTLSYTPAEAALDGTFRQLHVDVARPGLELKYRHGYSARADAHPAKGVAKAAGAQPGAVVITDDAAIFAAMRLGAPPPRDVWFNAHIDPSPAVLKMGKGEALPSNNFLGGRYRNEGYREYTIHYTVDPATLSIGKGANDIYQGRVDLIAVVYDDLGNTINSVISKASIHANQQMLPRLKAEGVQVAQTIAIPARGNFFLRVGVQDRMSAKTGVLEVPVDAIKLDGAPPPSPKP